MTTRVLSCDPVHGISVTLRPPVLERVELCAPLFRNTESARMLRVPRNLSIREFLENFLATCLSEEWYVFWIHHQNEFAGQCEIGGIRREGPHRLSASVMCALLPEFEGLGLATEAVQRMVAFALYEASPRIHTLHAKLLVENTKSHSLIQRTGFQFKELIREPSIFHEGGEDLIWHGTISRA